MNSFNTQLNDTILLQACRIIGIDPSVAGCLIFCKLWSGATATIVCWMPVLSQYALNQGGDAVLHGVGTAQHSSCGPAMYEDVCWVAVSSAPYECQLHNYTARAWTLVRIDEVCRELSFFCLLDWTMSQLALRDASL